MPTCMHEKDASKLAAAIAASTASRIKYDAGASFIRGNAFFFGTRATKITTQVGHTSAGKALGDMSDGLEVTSIGHIDFYKETCSSPGGFSRWPRKTACVSMFVVLLSIQRYCAARLG